jgi:hypothetical protein
LEAQGQPAADVSPGAPLINEEILDSLLLLDFVLLIELPGDHPVGIEEDRKVRAGILGNRAGGRRRLFESDITSPTVRYGFSALMLGAGSYTHPCK